ncbi:AAA family ATPase [Planktotalea sp.]|uniref:AAA family ATPase n=1 Tax=Planktotalea sp. TaxID=2029877 RepID=UPI0032983393
MLYRSAGKFIDSVLSLPSFTEVRETVEPDICVRFGHVPQDDWQDSLAIQGWHRIDDGLQFKASGIGAFRVDKNGARIVLDCPVEKRSEASAYVTGSALGAALHLSGSVVLHASAIATEHGAVLFCGPSGAGKSTLAASFVQRGYSMLSDDICALQIVGDQVQVQPDGRFLKLWQPAIHALGADAVQRDRVLGNRDKFHVDFASTHLTPLPVRALYDLAWATDGPPRVRPLSPGQAFATFVGHAYRPGLVAALGAQPAYFDTVTALQQTAPIQCLTRPVSLAELDFVVDTIENDLRDLGPKFHSL